MPLLLHVLGKCLIKIPIIWQQQSNKNNTPTQKVFKIFANINVNFAGSSQVVEAIPVCLPLPARLSLSLSLSFVCTFIFAIKAKISALEMAKATAKHTATTTAGEQEEAAEEAQAQTGRQRGRLEGSGRYARSVANKIPKLICSMATTCQK